nr:alpha/beta hydrolase [Corynebacterium lactis]
MNSLSDTLDGPWQHRMVHAHGQRLHVAECGTATDPLVLFIHGSTGGWFEWREVLPLLADAPIHAVAISLRGYGLSDRTPRGYDPDVAAEDVAGLIRALGHSTALLVGQGFGTWISWTLAARHPELVAGIVGCGSAHPRVWLSKLRSPWSQEFRSALAPTLGRLWWSSRPQMPRQLKRLGGRRPGAQSQQDRIIERLVGDAMGSTAPGFAKTATGRESAELMRNSLQDGALRVAKSHIEWWTKPKPGSFRRWLKAVDRPLRDDQRTILLVGSEDRRTPQELVRQSASQVLVIDGAGHYLPVEAPEAVADAVRARLDWLPRY